MIDRRLNRLAPRFARTLVLALSECRRRGLSVGVFEGWRSEHRQASLYRLGRSIPGNVVTNARDSSYSWHGYGLAADVVFVGSDGAWDWSVPDPDWDDLARVMEDFGIWRPIAWDKPHFQPRAVPPSPSEVVRGLMLSGNVTQVWRLFDQD